MVQIFSVDAVASVARAATINGRSGKLGADRAEGLVELCRKKYADQFDDDLNAFGVRSSLTAIEVVDKVGKISTFHIAH